MEIKREEIEKRLAQAEITKNKKITEAQIAEGIIQDCKHWLTVLDKTNNPKKGE